MNELKRYGSRTLTITQSLADFGMKLGEDGSLVRLDGSRVKAHAAFKDWMYKLKPGERLPRGRWFRGKKPGRPVFIRDEFNLMRPDATGMQSHRLNSLLHLRQQLHDGAGKPLQPINPFSFGMEPGNRGESDDALTPEEAHLSSLPAHTYFVVDTPPRSMLWPSEDVLEGWRQATGLPGGLEEYQRWMLEKYQRPMMAQPAPAGTEGNNDTDTDAPDHHSKG